MSLLHYYGIINVQHEKRDYDVELVTQRKHVKCIILEPHLFPFDGCILISLHQTVGVKLVSLKFTIWIPQLCFCGSYANKHFGN